MPRQIALTLVPAAVALMTTAGLLLGTVDILGGPQDSTDEAIVVRAATVSTTAVSTTAVSTTAVSTATASATTGSTTSPDCLTARRGVPSTAPAPIDAPEGPILPPRKIVLSTGEEAGRPLPSSPLAHCDRQPSADPRLRS